MTRDEGRMIAVEKMRLAVSSAFMYDGKRD
jgi:hypothetical protein